MKKLLLLLTLALLLPTLTLASCDEKTTTQNDTESTAADTQKETETEAKTEGETEMETEVGDPCALPCKFLVTRLDRSHTCITHIIKSATDESEVLIVRDV